MMMKAESSRRVRAIFQDKPAGRGHRDGLGRVAKGARVACELLALEPGDGEHIIQIITETSRHAAGPFGDQADIIAMKKQRADMCRDGRQKGGCLPRRNLHQEPDCVKKR